MEALLFSEIKREKLQNKNTRNNTEVINYLPTFPYDKSFCIQNYIWFSTTAPQNSP